ncbi:ABCB10 [Symbiodinium sp. CCMP2592]|nr:ABCB10 [Symbiodinium sp. CCMP2592]
MWLHRFASSRCARGHAWTGCRIYNKMHPPQGMKHLVLARFSASPSQPASDDKERTTASLPQLWQILRPERGRLQLALAALCASSSVNLSYPYMVGKLVDLFGQGADGLQFVMDHTWLCAGVMVAGGFATFCRLYLIETAIERIAFRLRREFFWALIQRPIAFFDGNKTGELVNRLGNDITMTSRVLIDASAGIRSCITACVGTCMVFQLAPTEMILGLLTPVATLFVVGFGYGRVVRRIAEKRQQRLAEAVQRAEERLGGIRTVRTFNAEKRELAGFERLLDSVYEAGWQNALAMGGLSCFFVTGGGLFLIHIIYNCGLMVTSGVVSIGTTVSLGMYCFMAGSAYTGIMTSYGDIQKCLGSCQKVLEILSQSSVQPMLTDSIVSAVSPAHPPLAVKFESVSFSYPTRPTPVLQNLSLDIPAGARVALLGRSGSGKSTVALLLAGLYPPSQGKIFVDDRDMYADDSTPSWVRSQLGVISQEPTLFALTIRENVEYGVDGENFQTEEASEENSRLILEATSAAHVNEFAEHLPLGLDTPAGERGQALSGGQKQRVCIARALARKPRMLVFDEATSALDLRSERLVHKALKEVLSAGDCTCLVITHRMSALEWCDRVAVVHEGSVVQYGEKNEVLNNPCAALQSILRNDDHLHVQET